MLGEDHRTINKEPQLHNEGVTMPQATESFDKSLVKPSYLRQLFMAEYSNTFLESSIPSLYFKDKKEYF